jgi:hypothetical protein
MPTMPASVTPHTARQRGNPAEHRGQRKGEQQPREADVEADPAARQVERDDHQRERHRRVQQPGKDNVRRRLAPQGVGEAAPVIEQFEMTQQFFDQRNKPGARRLQAEQNAHDNQSRQQIADRTPGRVEEKGGHERARQKHRLVRQAGQGDHGGGFFGRDARLLQDRRAGRRAAGQDVHA